MQTIKSQNLSVTKISWSTVVFRKNHGCQKGPGGQGFTPARMSFTQGYFHKKKKKEPKELSSCSIAHLFIAYYNVYPATWNLMVTALSNHTHVHTDVSQENKIKEELTMITMTTTTIGLKIFWLIYRANWTKTFVIP